MPENDLFLRAARREKTERTPVWLMRQAGRFDPEYLAIREQAEMPLELMFRDPDLAAEISLLPKRFGVDAIIFFQDILTPLAPMGIPFAFRPGPVTARPIRTAADVASLRRFDPDRDVPFVPQTLCLVRDALRGELPLLGFAGAPLTLAFFMIEGGSPSNGDASAEPAAPHARSMMQGDPALPHRLLDMLADMTADYLAMQIEAGVDAVQLFESCADLLTPEEYREFAHPYHERIFARLGGRVPTILFAKEQTCLELMARSGADVLSVGTGVDIADASVRFGDTVAIQGNLDNRLVAGGTPDEVQEAVRKCVRAGGHTGHILNLNHGLLKETPVENVVRLIETCKRTSVRPNSAQPARV